MWMVSVSVASQLISNFGALCIDHWKILISNKVFILLKKVTRLLCKKLFANGFTADSVGFSKCYLYFPSSQRELSLYECCDG